MGAFDSLRYRDYRLLWIGAAVSNVGTWMQNVALSWYVFQLTGSPFWVGAVNFANFIPMVVAPLGGVVADRRDRRSVLLITQSAMMLDTVVLAALASTGHANRWVVLALAAGVGLCYAFNGPSWQSFVPSLVPPQSLVNAIALNSAQFSAARVVGPAIGGVLVATAGPSLVFWINAGSFVAVIGALWLIRRRGAPRQERSERLGAYLASGLRHAWANTVVRRMLLAIGAVSLFAAPISALLPVFAKHSFHRGSGAFGALVAAMGAGSLLGALLLGRTGRAGWRAIAFSMVVLGASLIAFALTRVFGLALGLMVVVGGAYLFSISGINSAIQTAVDDAYRGRVMSLFMLAFGGLYPVGSLVAGAVANSVGAARTTVTGAAVCATWGLGLFLLRHRPRPAEGPEVAPA